MRRYVSYLFCCSCSLLIPTNASDNFDISNFGNSNSNFETADAEGSSDYFSDENLATNSYSGTQTDLQAIIKALEHSANAIADLEIPVETTKVTVPVDEQLVKDTIRVKDWYLDTTALTMNGKRSQDEDAILLTSPLKHFPDARLFALFDGHGGQEVSRKAANFAPTFIGGVPSLDATSIAEACLAMDEAIKVDKKQQRGGSTGIMLVLEKPDPNVEEFMLHAANIGDSRSFIIHRDQTYTMLSEDHKPSDPLELQRITAAGGFVSDGYVNRVNGTLALSRAFGDFHLKNRPDIVPSRQKVVAVPDVRKVRVVPGDIIVTACDGVFEARGMSWMFVATFVNKLIQENPDDLEQVAVRLVNIAYFLGSGDNISVMISRVLDTPTGPIATGAHYQQNEKRDPVDVVVPRITEHKSGAQFDRDGLRATLF